MTNLFKMERASFWRQSRGAGVLLLFATFLLVGMMGISLYRLKTVEQTLDVSSKQVDTSAAGLGAEYVLKKALHFSEAVFRKNRNTPSLENFPIDSATFTIAEGSFKILDEDCQLSGSNLFENCLGSFSATVHLNITDEDRAENSGLPDRGLFYFSCEGSCGFRCPDGFSCDQNRSERFAPSRVSGRAVAFHGESLQSLDFSFIVEMGSIFEPGFMGWEDLDDPLESGPVLHPAHLNFYEPVLKLLRIQCATNQQSYEDSFEGYLEDLGISRQCSNQFLTSPSMGWESESIGGGANAYIARYDIPRRLRFENYCRDMNDPKWRVPTPQYEGDWMRSIDRWIAYLEHNSSGDPEQTTPDLRDHFLTHIENEAPVKVGIDCHDNRQRLQVYEESGFNAPVYSFEVMGEQLFVGGGFTSAGGKDANRVVSWNGSTWAKLGGGPILDPSSSWAGHRVARALKSYNDGSGTALYVGGFSWMNHYSFQKWNGSEWSLVHPPTEAGNFFASVRAIGVYDGGLFPAGMSMFPGCVIDGSAQNCYIARWDGSGWTNIVQYFTADIYAFEVFQGALYVGSSTTFIKPIGLPQFPPGTTYPDGYPRLAKWDGSTWSADLVKFGSITALKAMVEGIPMGLDEDVEVLYAAGGFTEIGGVAANNIARWDGSSWSTLGAGISGGSIWALESYRGQLIAAGSFNSAGGVSVNNIARWDGENWHALGSGLNGTVNALKSFDDGSGPALYVGGEFTMAGGQESAYIAKWDGSEWHRFGYGISEPTHHSLRGPRSVAFFDDSIDIISANFCGESSSHKVTIVSKNDVSISSSVIPADFLELEEASWNFEKMREKAAEAPRNLAIISGGDILFNLEGIKAIAVKDGSPAPIGLSEEPISEIASGTQNILGGLIIAQLAAHDRIETSDIALDAVPVLISGPVSSRYMRSHRLSNASGACAKQGSTLVVDIGPRPTDPFKEPRAPAMHGGFRYRIIQNMMSQRD